MSRKIILYETDSGETPIEDFVKSLSEKEQQKIIWGLKILEDGFPLKEPYFKKIASAGDLWELRITQGGNTFRVYFLEYSRTLIILLCGFQKKNDKDQRRDIEKAIKLMLEAKERKYEDA